MRLDKGVCLRWTGPPRMFYLNVVAQFGIMVVLDEEEEEEKHHDQQNKNCNINYLFVSPPPP